MILAEDLTNAEFLQLPFYDRGYMHGSHPVGHRKTLIQDLTEVGFGDDDACSEWYQGWLDGLGDINMLQEWEQYLADEMTHDEWTSACVEMHKQILLVRGSPYHHAM